MTAAAAVEANPTPLLVDWEIKRVQNKPWKIIQLRAPNGYTARVSELDRNPENVLYMLGDAILTKREGQTSTLNLDLERIETHG